MVCDIQELLSANPCISNLNPHMLEVVETQLLCGLFNHLDSGAEFTCDIEALLADSSCFYNLSSQQLRIIRVQMLCNIGALT